MNSSWLCVDANLVIRLVADPADESVKHLWEQSAMKNTRFFAQNLRRWVRFPDCSDAERSLPPTPNIRGSSD